MNENLFTRLFSGAPLDLSRPLIETRDQTLSWADVRAGAERVAGALADAGVEPGDRVALRIEKSPEIVSIYLGCLRAGAVLVPLNPAYTEAEVAPLLEDAEPSLLITDRPKRAAEIAAQTLLEGSAAHAPAPTEGGRAPAAMLFTSGTTGRSKGALLSHNNLWANGVALARTWKFSSRDRLLHILPVFHVHGLFVAMNPIMLSGACMRWQNQFDPAAAVAALDGCSVLMAVPTHYGRMLAEGNLHRDAARTMRLFTSGSAPLPPQLFEDIESATGHQPVERYGMTETGMLTSNPFDGLRIPGSVGPALPGTELRIVDETLATVAPGKVGSVQVRGPQVGPGYWRRPDADEASRAGDRYFITGDLGYLDDGGYLHLVGRQSDLIISGGLNVYPREVESALESLPQIREAAVFGVPHPDFGEAVVATVIVEGTPSQDDLRAAIADRLAGFKIPKRILPCTDLPKNAMGKVDKVRLRREHTDLFA